MKITKLFALSIAVLLFSCGEDDEPKLPTVEGMVATWNVTNIDYSGTTTTSYAGQTATANFTGVGKDMDYTITFSTSPNTVVSEGGYTIELTTTVAGQSTTEDYEFDEAFMDGTWELNGKTLTITSDGESQEGTVTKQTDDVLHVTVNVDETTTDTDFGYTIRTKVKAVYKFEKINP